MLPAFICCICRSNSSLGRSILNQNGKGKLMMPCLLRGISALLANQQRSMAPQCYTQLPTILHWSERWYTPSCRGQSSQASITAREGKQQSKQVRNLAHPSWEELFASCSDQLHNICNTSGLDMCTNQRLVSLVGNPGASRTMNAARELQLSYMDQLPLAAYHQLGVPLGQ